MTPLVRRYVPSPPTPLISDQLLTQRDEQVSVLDVVLGELEVLLHDNVLAHELQLSEAKVRNRDVDLGRFLPKS
jgi:hypothetical protein